MSHVTKLAAALAAASVLVLSASAAHATINIPKPVISIPRPVVSVAVPKPVFVTSTPINAAVRPSVFAGKPAIAQNTVSNWHGPAGAGTQSTSMIYQNGKVVGAISLISKYPATTAPKPATGPVASNSNNIPIRPGAVQIVNDPAPATPAPAASHPAPAKAAATPPAPKKITFTPVEYPAFKDQYGSVKGYYVNGKLVMGLKGPSGSACTTAMAYQTSGGSVSPNYSSGAAFVTVVQCYIRG